MERFLQTAARRHLLVLGLLTALSLLLSWPLPAQLSTHVPGVPQWAFDEATFVWNIWHFKHALIDHLRSPLHSELIWYPLGIDLVLYTYNFYHVLAALPLALATSLPLASNVTLLTSTVLSGYGTWLLASSLLAKGGPQRAPSIFWGALAAGLLYAFASNRAVYTALGHYDMVTTQWIPFYTLALLRALDPQLDARRRRLWAVLGGLFFALTGLAEMISALFLAMFTLLVLAVQFRRLLATWRATLESLLWLGLVAFLVWAPALLPIVHALSSADYTLSGWGDALALSADLLGWFTATVFHPLWGGDVVQEMRLVQQRAVNPALGGLRDINTVFLGWVTLALALLGSILFWRTVRLWVWTSLVFGVLTLGPLLQINGRYRFDLDGLETTFPLPFALLHFLPVVQANRAPNRNSVLLMLGLALLVGYAVCWLLDQFTRRAGWLRPALASLLAAALIFEHLAWPLPLSDARVPAIYAQIASEPGEFSLLQLPLGWRNSFGVLGPEKTLLQYYQTAHGKPMLGGDRTIGNTGVSLPVDVDLKAFADGGFIALFDEQGEQSDGSAGRRGVNLTVLDPHSGRLLDKAGFDTAASATESDRLVAYVSQIEAGSVVLAVTSGDATAFLSEAALQAMRRIGADLPQSQVQGQYFAVAGVTGAAPGTAVQVIDDEDAFLRVSLNRDRRTLAAAVARVTVTGP